MVNHIRHFNTSHRVFWMGPQFHGWVFYGGSKAIDTTIHSSPKMLMSWHFNVMLVVHQNNIL